MIRSSFVLLLLPLAACATAVQPAPAEVGAVPSLEAALAAEPDDALLMTRLGVAYHDAGRHTAAVDVLARAVATGEADPVAHLYLGLSHEATGEWSSASDAYVAFLANAPADARVRRDVERRLPLVERRVMEQQLQTMLAQEDVLAERPPEPRTVAVFPFRIVSDDPRYAPLQHALADMVTTDLGIPGTLRMLERAQIQALVREMALTLAGYADPSNGARVGRLMRAEQVVQGSVVLLGEEQLRMEMVVVDPVAAERRGEASGESAVEQIFDAEKRLVLEVLGLLGVTLTPTEREAIEENRTSSLIALLSYGTGLDAMDRGDFAAAGAAFGEAARLDPDFEAAQTMAEEAAELQQAAETTTSQVAAAAQAELVTALPEAAPAAMPGDGGPVAQLVDQIIPDINPSGLDALAGAVNDGAEIASEPTIQNPNSNAGAAGGTRIPIRIDNPNVP